MDKNSRPKSKKPMTTTKPSSKSKRKIANTNSSRSKSTKTATSKPGSNSKSMTSTTKKPRSNSKSKKPMTTKKPRCNSKSHSHNTKHNDHGDREEMDLIQATSYSTFFQLNYTTIHSIRTSSNFSAKRSFSNYASLSAKECQLSDIEDSCDFWRTTTQKRRKLAPSSLFKRFRNTTGLFVTDITATV